jgi:hypothetical protein
MKLIRHAFFMGIVSLASVSLHAMNEDKVRLNIDHKDPVYVGRRFLDETLHKFCSIGSSRLSYGLVVLQKKCNREACTSTYDSKFKAIGLMETDGTINETIKKIVKYTIVVRLDQNAVYVRESEFVEIPDQSQSSQMRRRSHVGPTRPIIEIRNVEDEIDLGGVTFEGQDQSITAAITELRRGDEVCDSNRK